MGAFDASVAPFTAALTLMGLIALAEIVGALIGVMPSAFLDGLLPDFDADGDSPIGHVDYATHSGGDHNLPQSGGFLAWLLNWLCIGRVPVLVLLVAFLTAFGVTGWAVQGFAVGFFGFPLWNWIAVVPALVVAVPSMRWLGLGLARLIPSEESEASSTTSFIGRIAVVGAARARQGLPAEAKLTDQYRQAHYVRVEPDGDFVLEPGSEVLLVTQVGGVFRAVPNTNTALSRS